MRTFLFLLFMAILSSTSEAALPKIMVEDAWPPFAFKKQGQPAGLSVDLVKEAFHLVDEKPQLVQVPYPRCLALTAAGKFPACFNSAHSSEMNKDFLFPKESLFKSRGLIVTNLPVSARLKIEKVTDLEGRSVALPTGFPFGPQFDENKKIKKIFTASDYNSLRMLKANRVAFIAIDEFVYYYLVKENPEFRDFSVLLLLSEEDIFVHFAKNEEGRILLKKFEVGLAKLKKSPRYQEILESWIGPIKKDQEQILTSLPEAPPL